MDQVYLINLERRPERKALMDAAFDELGVKYEWIKATDGKTMDQEFLKVDQQSRNVMKRRPKCLVFSPMGSR